MKVTSPYIDRRSERAPFTVAAREGNVVQFFRYRTPAEAYAAMRRLRAGGLAALTRERTKR